MRTAVALGVLSLIALVGAPSAAAQSPRHARLDRKGGFTVRAPRTPGRYMLLMTPTWRTTCVTTQDAQSVLSVVVR